MRTRFIGSTLDLEASTCLSSPHIARTGIIENIILYGLTTLSVSNAAIQWAVPILTALTVTASTGPMLLAARP